MIHHATVKRAENNGVVLTEEDDGTIVAHTPKVNRYHYGNSPKAVLAAAIVEKRFALVYSRFRVRVKDDDNLIIGIVDTDDENSVQDLYECSIEDNPEDVFVEVTELCDEQGVSFDDDDDGEEGGESSGSIVKSAYKRKYKENGDPTSCNDWFTHALRTYNRTRDTDEDGNPKGKEKYREDRQFAILQFNGVDMNANGLGSHINPGQRAMNSRRLLLPKCRENGFLGIPGELTEDGSDIQIKPPKGESWPTH